MAAFTALAIASLASTALSTYGQVRSGKAAKAAGEHAAQAAESEAQLDDFNAHVADLQATDAIERGAEQEGKYRVNIRQTIGAQRAGYAGGNIDVGYGSAVDVQADAAFLGELDALTIRTNAGREAWGYNVQAIDLRKRAAITRKEGSFAQQAGAEQAKSAYLGAAGTIAGGTMSLMQMRYGFRDTASSSAGPTSSARIFTASDTQARG